jgi:hypothetical protein
VVAGLWAEVEEDRERLLVEFELVGIVDEHPLFKKRPTLPPRHLDDRMDSVSPWEEARIAQAMEQAAERAWPSKPGHSPSSMSAP